MPTTPIGELRGISQGAVVALSRAGIVTAEDLQSSDIEQVAYLVDSDDIAQILLTEAGRVIRLANPKKRKSTPKNKATAEHAAESPDDADATQPPSPPERTLLIETLGLLTQAAGDVLSAKPNLALAQRLRTLELLFDIGCEQTEAIASLLIGAVGERTAAIPPDEVAPRFGADVATLLDECSMVLGVPMTPTGNSQSAYQKTVASVSAAARAVCAAHATASILVVIELAQREGSEVWRRFPGGREITLWYFRAMRDALAADQKVPFSYELDQAVDALEQIQSPAAA
ncbi:MAG: hypothetical protein IID31_13530 [Planctomycetes bacterium]|nr:hypothetical protein [Planctomycetota bacterium]